jgi:hypothetical protein
MESRKTGQNSQKICKWFESGNCRDGSKCRFRHPKVCTFFSKGGCNKGEKCEFLHTMLKVPHEDASKKVDKKQSSEKKRSSEKKQSSGPPKKSNIDTASRGGKNSDVSAEMNEFLTLILKKKNEKQLNNQSPFIQRLNIKLWKGAIDLLAQDKSGSDFLLRFIPAVLVIYLSLPDTTDNTPNVANIIILLQKGLKQLQSSDELTLVNEVISKRLLRIDNSWYFGINSGSGVGGLDSIAETVSQFHSFIQNNTSDFIVSLSKKGHEKVKEGMKTILELTEGLEGYRRKLNEIRQENVKSGFSAAEGGNGKKEASLSLDRIDRWYQEPTIEWLTGAFWFKNTRLKLHYDSIDEYSLTLQKLWTELSFYWGIAAFWPKCRSGFGNASGGDKGKEAANNDKKVCNAPLLCSVMKAIPCSMRLKGGRLCSNSASWTCHQRGHDAICDDCCQKKAYLSTLSPKDDDRRNAPTDVYDGIVSDVRHFSESLILNLSQVASRKPPEVAVNWKTSYRLQPCNLVGVVKLHTSKGNLPLDNRIYWGEVIVRNTQEDERAEYGRREKGQLTVRLLSKSDSVLLSNEAEYPFSSQSRVAVIDCRVFVPEVFSVLSTLSHESFKVGLQKVPFSGALLGSGDNVDEVHTILFVDHKKAINDAIVFSSIPSVKSLTISNISTVIKEICGISLVTTLDKTQLEAFCKGLMTSFHATQGPPGTGKSYVGVCLVLALNIIRKALIRQGKSIGPILTLSYKNHALDEFLKDVKDNCLDDVGRIKGRLIRIGKPELAELLPFTEKSSSNESEARRVLDQRLLLLRKNKLLLQSVMKLNYSVDQSSAAVPYCELIAIYFLLLKELNDYFSFQEIVPELAYNVLVKVLEQKNITFFNDLLFMTEVEHWIQLPLTNEKGKNSEQTDQAVDPVRKRIDDLLSLWLEGVVPPSRCSEMIFLNDNRIVQCRNCASDPSPFCLELHSCIFSDCLNRSGGVHTRFCDFHQCQSPYCANSRIGSNVMFCQEHICPFCYEFPKNSAEGFQACSVHTCSLKDCKLSRFLPFDFCFNHVCLICRNEGVVNSESKQSPFINRNHQKVLSCFCFTHKCAGPTCDQPKVLGLNFCLDHACAVCGDASVQNERFCELHLCSFEDGCSNARIILENNQPSLYCIDHTCSLCVQSGEIFNSSSSSYYPPAYPPRYTCMNHPLCQQITKDGNFCDKLIDFENGMFCKIHIPRFDDGRCNGVAKKTKKQCKAFSLTGQLYCKDHMDQGQTIVQHSGKSDNSKENEEILGFNRFVYHPFQVHPHIENYVAFDASNQSARTSEILVMGCRGCGVLCYGDPNWTCCAHSFDTSAAWPAKHVGYSTEAKLAVPASESKENLSETRPSSVAGRNVSLTYIRSSVSFFQINHAFRNCLSKDLLMISMIIILTMLYMRMI